MKKFIVLLLVFSVLGLSGNLFAKEKRGAELIVQIKGGQHVKGELITIKKDALLLLNPEGADIGIDIDDISVIKIVKKSKAWLGPTSGILFGGGFVALSAVSGEAWARDVAFFAGVIGLLTGVIYGVLVGIDKTIQIEGKSEAEVKMILEKLRKKARVRDFQ